MKFNHTNNNVKLIKRNNFFLTRENAIIFFFLIIFTAISTILISFCSDTLFNSFSQLDKDGFLLKTGDTYTLTREAVSCFSIKQDLNNNKLSVFNFFIDLFQKNPSVYKYFPSYFQTFVHYKNDAIVNDTSSFIVREVVSYNQYLMLEYHNDKLNDLLKDLCKILLEYKGSNNL